MSSFLVKEAPDALTLVQHLKTQTAFQQASDALSGQTSSQLLAIPPAGLYEGLQDAAYQAIEAHGLRVAVGGRTSSRPQLSISFAGQPRHARAGDGRCASGHAGYVLNPINEFFYNSVQRHRGLKNTYFDSYGFRVRTPAARLGELGGFLDQCGLTLIRSRLSVLIGERGITSDFMDGWHRDEPVFENLRLNIP